MGSPIRAPFAGAALVTAGLLVMASCGGGSSPQPPATQEPAPAPAPGATRVTGSERLIWNQHGDVSRLGFLAYVNGNRVALPAATCSTASSPAECGSPLPPLTDGVHTIALAAVASGAEGPLSDPITVQKVSARSVVGAASFPDARAGAGLGLETIVTGIDGQSFAVDVVARGLQAPLQLAPTPDGRVLVADATGQVRVLHPGEPDRAEPALDARVRFDPPPVGALGLTRHPDFARNRMVYVSFFAREESGAIRLRLVRLRELDDALGEAATLFESPVIVEAQAGATAESGSVPGATAPGPRLAFGPDRLLYVLLPPGVSFDREPAASRPHPSILRLEDDGRGARAGPLSGIVAHSLALAWHPSSAAPWGIVPERDGALALRPMTDDAVVLANASAATALRMTRGTGSWSGTLALRDPGMLEWAPAASTALELAWMGTIRLSVPIVIQGLFDASTRVADVATDGGTLFLATSEAMRTGEAADDRSGLILRLRPRP